MPSQYTIRIGEYNLYLPDMDIDYQVAKIIIHSNYTGLTPKRKSTKNADIALIRTKDPIVFGDHAWPICFFDSEEEEKESLLELRRASKTVKKNLGKELNYKNNDFVEHQLSDDELMEDNYFSILDESNCESYSQLDLQTFNNVLNNENQQSNYLDSNVAAKLMNSSTSRNLEQSHAMSLKSSMQQTTNLIKYPTTYPTNEFPNSIGEDETLTKINVTKLSKLANLVIVVGWGKKHEKADHYSSYLQKSTLCLIPNSGEFFFENITTS